MYGKAADGETPPGRMRGGWRCCQRILFPGGQSDVPAAGSVDVGDEVRAAQHESHVVVRRVIPYGLGGPAGAAFAGTVSSRTLYAVIEGRSRTAAAPVLQQRFPRAPPDPEQPPLRDVPGAEPEFRELWQQPKKGSPSLLTREGTLCPLVQPVTTSGVMARPAAG